MEVLELKAMLYRSNPTVIRQFTVPTAYEADAIGQILLVLSGLDGKGKWEIQHGDQKVNGKVTVQDLFRVDDPIQFRFCRANNDSGQMLLDGIDMGGTFRFVVSCINRTDQEEQYPMILRWCGDNLPKSIHDTVQYNRFMQKKESGASIYYYGEYAQFMREDLGFDLRTAQRALKAKYGNGGGENDILLELDYENAVPLKAILSGRNMNELRELNNFYVLSTAKHNKKAELVEAIYAGLNRDLRMFEDCMSYMTAGEYEIFKKICSGQDLTGMNVGVVCNVKRRFIKCCLMDGDEFDYEYEDGRYGSFNDPYIDVSRELLDQYEIWLESGKEVEFLKKAYAYTTLSAGVLLYGFLYKKDWKTYAGSLVPGGMTDKELDEVWNQYTLRCTADFRSNVHLHGREIIYSTLSFGDNIDERELRELESVRALSAYRPGMEELVVIETEGLYFDEKDERLLVAALESKAGVYEWTWKKLCQEIYLFFHNGHDENRVIEYLSKCYSSRGQGNSMQEFRKILANLRGRVRQINLAGHTSEEVRSIANPKIAAVSVKKEKRVYPNDPCPCGSGKKYKKCHGKSGL